MAKHKTETTEAAAAVARPYLVTEYTPGADGVIAVDAKQTIVLAKSENAALKYCVEPRFSVRLLKAAEAAYLAMVGVKIEKAGVE